MSDKLISAVKTAIEIIDEYGRAEATEYGYVIRDLEDTISVLSQRQESKEREFPMQDGHNIPWSLAEKIYADYAAAFPSSAQSQSLERLAERGGFGWKEAEYLYKDTRAEKARRSRQ